MSNNASEPLSENRKVEVAKALLAVKSVATEEQFQTVRTMLVDSDSLESVDRAINGLSKEDEFALMCQIMGTATHLVPLEQRPIIRGEFQVPDFLARFQPGCTPQGKKSSDCDGLRCLVEVKSTTKDTYRISANRLRRLRVFCDQFTLPLILAVRFLRFGHAACWMMVEDDRSADSLSVTYSDLTEGVRNVVWDDYAFFIVPGIYFRAVFDSDSDDSGVRHCKYGTMREFHIVFPDGMNVSGAHVEGNVAKYAGSNATVISAFFEGFNPVEILADTLGTKTVVALQPQLNACTLADMLFTYNSLPRDEEGRVLFDPSRVLVEGDGSSLAGTREFIESVASDLMGSVLLVLGLGDAENNLSTWQRFGGKL